MNEIFKTLIGTREFYNDSEERVFEVSYFRMEKEEKEARERIYGVGLEKIKSGEAEASGVFEEFLTDDKEQADNILNKLIGHAVTPMGASEIIDYLYDKSFQAAEI